MKNEKKYSRIEKEIECLKTELKGVEEKEERIKAEIGFLMDLQEEIGG